MTRLPDPWRRRARLPQGSMVIVRARDASAPPRAGAKRCAPQTHGLILLAPDDPVLARRRCTACICREARAREAAHWRALQAALDHHRGGAFAARDLHGAACRCGAAVAGLRHHESSQGAAADAGARAADRAQRRCCRSGAGRRHGAQCGAAVPALPASPRSARLALDVQIEMQEPRIHVEARRAIEEQCRWSGA